MLQYTLNIFLWTKFIDDILILWNGTRETFQPFVAHLNENGIFFTSVIDWGTTYFLDLNTFREDYGVIQTAIYLKPTSTNSLLHWKKTSLNFF